MNNTIQSVNRLIGQSVNIAVVLCPLLAISEQIEVAKWDPDMAIKSAVVTNNVCWIDGKMLPIEGRAFDDVELYYDRLPSNLTERINYGVAKILKHDSAGMQFRFTTTSKELHLRWKPLRPKNYMDHMASTGHSGIDVYRYDEAKNRWYYLVTGRPERDGDKLVKGGAIDIPWQPGRTCLVNLPLYNGIAEFTLGIDADSTISAAPKRKSGIEKPVVFYGTSITQGGCASRPGMAFPSIIGRELDVPIVNLGFSGSGRMELDMADVIARIDASCYVLDCLWNMKCRVLPDGDPAEADLAAAGVGREFTPESECLYVATRYEKFIRRLRSLRPETPIVMAEMCNVFCGEKRPRNLVMRKLYERLVAEGWEKLVYLPSEGMYPDDREGTVDGSHATDYGMVNLAQAYGKAIKSALKVSD